MAPTIQLTSLSIPIPPPAQGLSLPRLARALITGDWDLLIKPKAENVDTIGKFIIDRLRFVRGIEKTLTCMVFETCKETTEIPISVRRRSDKTY